MRDYDDRDGDKKERWDKDVPQIILTTKSRRFRFVGPVQDIAVHWCIQEAGEYADKIAELKADARKKGREFKKPREPKGVPFLCPKFDLFREKFIDYVDPVSGEGFQKGEVLVLQDLVRHGVKLPDALTDPKKAKKAATLRFSPKSVEASKAIRVQKVMCAAHDDFSLEAGVRTWWYAFARTDDSNKGGDFGVVGKSGIPFTAMTQLKRISKERKMNPANPDHGYDLVITLDSSAMAQQMYTVKEPRGAEDANPLSPKERLIAFGKYELADGSTVNVLDVMRLKRENPDSLKGMKVRRQAGILPLEDMAREAVNADDMRQFMVRVGYYDPEGNPRPELFFEKKEKDGEKGSGWSTKDDDEDEKPKSRRDREEKPVARAKPSRARDEDDEDEAPAPRKKKPKAGAEGKKKIKKPVSMIEDEDD